MYSCFNLGILNNSNLCWNNACTLCTVYITLLCPERRSEIKHHLALYSCAKKIQVNSNFALWMDIGFYIFSTLLRVQVLIYNTILRVQILIYTLLRVQILIYNTILRVQILIYTLLRVQVKIFSPLSVKLNPFPCSQ